MSATTPSIKPILALIGACILWASSFPVMKWAFGRYDPLIVLCGRMCVGSLCFIPIGRRFRGLPYQAGDWKWLALLAFCEPCLYFTFEAAALVHTTASQAGMIVSLLPVMVAVAAWVILKEIITARTMIGFMVAVAGSIWLSTAAEVSETAPNPALGNFLEGLAMASAVGYIIIAKKMARRYPSLFLTAIQAWSGAAYFLLIIQGPWTTKPTHLDLGVVGAMLYLGAFITLGAYGLYNYGLSRIPANQASAFANLIPVFAVLMGWLFLGETFNSSQYMACLVVLAGVFLSQDFRRAPVR